MTVKELIAELEKADPDMPVIVSTPHLPYAAHSVIVGFSNAWIEVDPGEEVKGEPN